MGRNNCSVCCGALTGFTLTLLSGGKIIHSFQVACATHNYADYLWNLDLIILAEASVIPSFLLQAIDKALRDITSIAAVFDGKVVFLGEGFRKVLPILSRGTSEAIIEICIKHSLP